MIERNNLLLCLKKNISKEYILSLFPQIKAKQIKLKKKSSHLISPTYYNSIEASLDMII